MEYIVALLVLVAVGILVWDKFLNKNNVHEENEKLREITRERELLFEENTRIKAELAQKSERLGEITRELTGERSEKDKFSGANKELILKTRDAEGELRAIRAENSELKKKLADFEAQRLQNQSEHEEKLKRLEHAQKSFEDEKVRIRREDEEKQEQERAELNRIWNDHETSTLSILRDACQKREIGFRFYENTNLPAGFDGSLKPDFLIDFLGQYLIFDAKKSKDLATYLNTQAKSTALKVKGNEKIYSTVFFVVPTHELMELRKYTFVENGVTFYAISPEAIEPILANFKKVTEFDNISDFDPKDRELIINLIANYDRHISFQNAANILFAKESIDLMNSKDQLKEELLDEIEIKKQTMRPIRLKDSDLSRISKDLHEQEKEIHRLTSPKAAIKVTEVEQAQRLFDAVQ